MSAGWKRTSAVVGSGILSSMVAPGVVYGAERLAPDQMTWLKKHLADHVIYPQLGFFDKLASNLNKAHEKHDQEKREEQIKRGEDVKPLPHYTPKQHAYNIADVLVQTSLALGTDFGVGYGLMKLINKNGGPHIESGKSTVCGAVVTLGMITIMPTLMAGISENMHHSLRHMIQKITGMSSDSADKLALSGVYVGIPAVAGMLAEVATAKR